MTSTTHTKQSDDHDLVKLADDLDADIELNEATLDGLQTRIDANIAALEDPAVDKKLEEADEDVSNMAVDVMNADATDMEQIDSDLAALDAEEDELLEDDERPIAETSEKLTSEDTGLPDIG